MTYTNTNRVLLIYTGGTIGMGRKLAGIQVDNHSGRCLPIHPTH